MDTEQNQSNTEQRFMGALRRFHELDADAIAGFGAQRALTEATRNAREDLARAEQNFERIRTAPQGRGSNLDRQITARALKRAERDLAEARAWVQAIDAACSAHKTECDRRGRLKQDCERLIGAMRQTLSFED